MKITTWRKVPICLLGYDIFRWEEPGGFDHWVPKFYRKLIFWKKFNVYGPTHIQYDSPWGFLITWPLCFHFWIRFKPQGTKVDENGVLVKLPGTEKVLFLSIGFARWDAYDSCYMVPRCYIGGHYD